MSQWIGSTNNKLYQARLLLELLPTAQEPALQQALEESALYQLRDAWFAYLHELAEAATYRGPVENFAQLLAATPLVTGEMRELQNLLDDSFSWLATLLASVEKIAQPKARPKTDPKAFLHAPKTEELAQRIDLIAVAASEPEFDGKTWWRLLSNLIDAQRSNRLEY